MFESSQGQNGTLILQNPMKKLHLSLFSILWNKHFYNYSNDNERFHEYSCFLWCCLCVGVLLSSVKALSRNVRLPGP